MSGLIARLREHFKWTLHNVVGHPLMEFFWLIGKEPLGIWFHDVTLPAHEEGEERG